MDKIFSRKDIWTVGDTFNFRSPTLVTNISWENKVWPVTLQDSASPKVFKFCVCISLYCPNLHLLFANAKSEWTILTTKQGLLVSYATRKVCFLTGNCGYKELIVELQIWKFIFWPQIWQSSWPFAELNRRFLFSPQLMAICRCRAKQSSFLMMQAAQ